MFFRMTGFRAETCERKFDLHMRLAIFSKVEKSPSY